MFAPEEETVENIKAWLTNFGIHGSRIVHSENKGWIAVDVTVHEAESLLLTEFHEHEHKHSPKVRVGCDKYVAAICSSLPLMIIDTMSRNISSVISTTSLRASNSLLWSNVP